MAGVTRCGKWLQKWWPSTFAPSLPFPFPGDRLSSILVNSSAKNYQTFIRVSAPGWCHPERPTPIVTLLVQTTQWQVFSFDKLWYYDLDLDRMTSKSNKLTFVVNCSTVVNLVNFPDKRFTRNRANKLQYVITHGGIEQSAFTDKTHNRTQNIMHVLQNQNGFNCINTNMQKC